VLGAPLAPDDAGPLALGEAIERARTMAEAIVKRGAASPSLEDPKERAAKEALP
jgi:hypothetical protein